MTRSPPAARAISAATEGPMPRSEVRGAKREERVSESKGCAVVNGAALCQPIAAEANGRFVHLTGRIQYPAGRSISPGYNNKGSVSPGRWDLGRRGDNSERNTTVPGLRNLIGGWNHLILLTEPAGDDSGRQDRKALLQILGDALGTVHRKDLIINPRPHRIGIAVDHKDRRRRSAKHFAANRIQLGRLLLENRKRSRVEVDLDRANARCLTRARFPGVGDRDRHRGNSHQRRGRRGLT